MSPHIDPLQSGAPSMTDRQKAQTRPVWDSSIAVAANTEQFANVSVTLGVPLAIPALCTGVTISTRDPAITTALFVYPAGGVVGQCTTDNAGTVLTDALQNFTTAGCSIGDRVRNLTDGSIAIVTAVGTTTLTMAADLSGGSDNSWDRFDFYRVETVDGPRIVLEGGINADRTVYLPIASDRDVSVEQAEAIYLLGEVATVDADVFYHFD